MRVTKVSSSWGWTDQNDTRQHWTVAPPRHAPPKKGSGSRCTWKWTVRKGRCILQVEIDQTASRIIKEVTYRLPAFPFVQQILEALG